MEKTRFGFNYLSDERKAMVLEALNRGDAVCIIPSCIGHTRAEMVNAQAENFFEEVGAYVVDVEHDMFKFYELGKAKIKWEDLNATEQTVTEKVLNDIESGEIDDTEDEIRWAAITWDQELGFLGYEEANIDNVYEMVLEFMKGR